jgi:hypothetical protein
MGKKRNAYRILVEKREGKRPLGKPRYRWKDSIKLSHRDGEGWTGLTWLQIRTSGLANITLKAVPFHMYASFPALLQFF